MKIIALSLLLFVFCIQINAQGIDTLQDRVNLIEQSLFYQTGELPLKVGEAKLKVPNGFRFLDRKQSIFILTELWGNPADSSVIGMLVPNGNGVLDFNSWVFTISYDDMGYVKDDDADDINYDDLLNEMQQECTDANPEREKQGYQAIEIIGWASQPYYDNHKKVLHWAKEIKFGKDTINTLNYNLRVLGRKGVFMLNAIATMYELPEVRTNIGKVINSIEFTEGNRYGDFKTDIDQVAAWTIGGLVAGKILAKVGLFALVLKFWKLIAIVFVAGGSAIWKFFIARKKQEEGMD